MGGTTLSLCPISAPILPVHCLPTPPLNQVTLNCGRSWNLCQNPYLVVESPLPGASEANDGIFENDIRSKTEAAEDMKLSQVHLFEHEPPSSSHFPCKTEDMIYNLYLTSTTVIEAKHFDEMLVSCERNTIPNQRIFRTLTPLLRL